MRLPSVPDRALAVLVAAGCATSPRPRQAAGYDLVIRGGTVYDGSGGAPVAPTSASAATASRRSATFRKRARDAQRRCERHGRRAGLHQRAVVGARFADRRRARRVRQPAGRHARDLRRRLVVRPAQRCDEEGDDASSRATSSTTIDLDDTRRIHALSREARRRAEHRELRRREHRAPVRRRQREPQGDAGRARARCKGSCATQ